MFQRAVAVDGQFDLFARQPPVGIIPIAGGHRAVFQPVGRFRLLFDLFLPGRKDGSGR